VSADRHVGTGGEPPNDRNGEGLAAVVELIEALTAASNYLTVASHLFGAEPRPAQEALRESFEKSLAQLRRANEAARRLRDFLRREAAKDTAGA